MSQSQAADFQSKAEIIQQHLDAVKRRNERLVLVLEGSRPWALRGASIIQSQINCHSALWVSGDGKNGIKPQDARQHLGQEYQLLVVD